MTLRPLKQKPTYLLSAALPSIMSAMLLTGCYAATHTAPIGQDEVKKEGAYAPSRERQLLASVTPQAPASWQPGKLWSITDDRLRVLLNAVDSTIPEQLAPSTLSFDTVETARNILGSEHTDIIFTLHTPTDVHGMATSPAKVSYRVDTPLDSFMKKPSLPIPFTIETSIVNDADSILRGRRLYVMTSTWLDDNGNYIKRRRFLPVIITKVSAGTPQAPLQVYFHLEEDPAVKGSLMLTLPSRPDADGPRDFASMFSLSNPRDAYKSIYPDIWDLITRGQVTQGMTREECRLSLGIPMETKRQEMYGYTRETWLYEAGTYLVFEDGILRNSRL